VDEDFTAEVNSIIESFTCRFNQENIDHISIANEVDRKLNETG